jgi:hypothetical protein
MELSIIIIIIIIIISICLFCLVCFKIYKYSDHGFPLMCSSTFISSGRLLTYRARICRILIAFYSSRNVGPIVAFDRSANFCVVPRGSVLGHGSLKTPVPVNNRPM